MTQIKVLDQKLLCERLAWEELIEEIRKELILDRVTSPDRFVLDIPMEDGGKGNLLIMPAWIEGEHIGVKLVTFSPNSTPSINASYIMFDGNNGKIQSVIDGDELTARRTAAASALASKYLSRQNAAELLIIGTGQLSEYMASAHATVRQFKKIKIWGRNQEKAEQISAQLTKQGLPATICKDLQISCQSANVISSVTSSSKPILFGDWITPGTHIDLVGSFKNDMRESDDVLISKAEVFVDTRSGASKAGDLSQPIKDGIFSIGNIKGDLKELTQGYAQGRKDAQSITIFKSAGFSLEDIVAAKLAVT